MNKVRWVVLLQIGMLLSTAGLADETKSSRTDDKLLPEATRSVDALLAESQYASRWRLDYPVDAGAFSDERQRPIADFNFRDGSVLGRVRKLRNLSLLTLAEMGQTRLFVGVNDDGLVGLHFNLFSRAGDERYLEVARMPYLAQIEPGSEVRQ